MYRLGDDEDAEDNVFLRGFDRIEMRSAARVKTDRRKKLLQYGMIGAAAVVAIVIIISLSVGMSRRSHKPYSCPDSQGATYDLTFFVIGDWGRRGNSNQRKVAAMMADIAGCMRPAFIVSTGDNFYDHGLRSASDPGMQESFRDVYNHPALQVSWYAVLGNHDYGDGIDPRSNDCAATSLAACPKDCCYSPVWQYTTNFNDIRWHCQNGTFSVPTGDSRLVDILMMDTTPFMSKYKSEPWYNNAAGIKDQDPAAIKRQLAKALGASSAKWKLVVGHHPIASFGRHCNYAVEEDCLDMAWLERDLQAAGVAAYFSGHEHNLQYINRLSDPKNSSSPASTPIYVISGAGSDVRSDEFSKYKPKGPYVMPYMADDQGFVAVRANSSHLVILFYAASHAEPVYTTFLSS